MLPPKIVEVTPQPDAVLLVGFADGTQRLFDVKPYLGSAFFSRLCDEAYFRQVRVAGGTICWPDGQDFDRSTPYFVGSPVQEPGVAVQA